MKECILIPFHSNADFNLPNHAPCGSSTWILIFFLSLWVARFFLLAVWQLYLKGSQDLSRYQLDRWSRYNKILHLIFFPQRSLKPNDVIRMLSLFSISQQDSQGVWDGLFTLQFICEERWQSDTLMIEKKNQPKEISARSKIMDLEWAIIF